jgi:HD-like signal output (HDOD) protein
MSGNLLSEAVQSLDADEAKRVKALLERGVKIPPQPRILDELRKHLSKKEFDLRVLSRIINQDPGVTAMLFKVVTNASYRQHQPFESVEQILHAIGVRQTFQLVQAIALAAMGDVTKNRLAYENFWARSQGVAQIAMLIADERIAVCNIFPDQAYLAGIFHDCGVLLLMQRFSTYGTAMRLGETGKWLDLAEEDARFNADHCVVGYLVARHWHLPEFICDAIRYHHAISEIGMHASRTMVAILQLAFEIYYRAQRVDNPEWAQVKAEVLPELGLNEDALPEFIDIIIERYHSEDHAGADLA